MIDVKKLEQKSNQLRNDLIDLIYDAKSGHPGGSLSAVEIFVSLYYYKMKFDAKNPDWEGRDRLIISKGHISPITYVTLADLGFFDKAELSEYRKFNGLLQGHIHRTVPGVELSTGSLGQGLSVANGMGFAARLKKQNHKIYCIMGDGEIQEGNVWEAAMTTAHHNLTNVVAIVDYNKVQENGFVNDIKNLEPLKDKWESFSWKVFSIDGNNLKELMQTLDKIDKIDDKPCLILANTVKGKGISFMEGQAMWHGKAPNDEEYIKAKKELCQF